MISAQFVRKDVHFHHCTRKWNGAKIATGAILWAPDVGRPGRSRRQQLCRCRHMTALWKEASVLAKKTSFSAWFSADLGESQNFNIPCLIHHMMRRTAPPRHGRLSSFFRKSRSTLFSCFSAFSAFRSGIEFHGSAVIANRNRFLPSLRVESWFRQTVSGSSLPGV